MGNSRGSRRECDYRLGTARRLVLAPVCASPKLCARPNFMRVTSYTPPMYVIDFTRTPNFGEAQRHWAMLPQTQETSRAQDTSPQTSVIGRRHANSVQDGAVNVPAGDCLSVRNALTINRWRPRTLSR